MKSTGNQATSWTVGKSAGGREAERAEHKVPDDVHHRCRDDLVEGVLQETAEPSPKEPFHLRNDEERNEDGPYQHTNRRGNEPITPMTTIAMACAAASRMVTIM